MLTLDKVYHAAFVLKEVARKTDLIPAPKLSDDCQVYLKTENLQVTGSSKYAVLITKSVSSPRRRRKRASLPVLPATMHRVWHWRLPATALTQLSASLQQHLSAKWKRPKVMAQKSA